MVHITKIPLLGESNSHTLILEDGDWALHWDGDYKPIRYLNRFEKNFVNSAIVAVEREYEVTKTDMAVTKDVLLGRSVPEAREQKVQDHQGRSSIVELSTGHVFSKGSVKAIGPLTYSGFAVYGVGFVVSIPVNKIGIRECENLRQEFVSKLLDDSVNSTV